MEQYVSFHKLMDYLKQEQVNSPRLNDFGYGDVVYFINDSGTTVTYPFLFITPVNITYAENTTTYSLQMIFADIVNTDLSNEIDVVSDMSLEARRFLSVVKRGFLMDKVDVTLPSIANSFFERFNDHVGGVVLNADIVVFEDINACDPYPSPTPTPTPTQTLGVCEIWDLIGASPGITTFTYTDCNGVQQIQLVNYNDTISACVKGGQVSYNNAGIALNTLVSCVSITPTTTPTPTETPSITSSPTPTPSITPTLTPSPSPLSPLLLNTYTGASLAFSVRQLDNTYTDSAFKVRRTSDNETLDIGYVGGELDLVSLSGFCAGTDGIVEIWYNQAGVGDLSQFISSQQSKIVSNGNVIYENLKPAISFDNDFYSSLYELSSSSDYLILLVIRIDSGKNANPRYFALNKLSNSINLQGGYNSDNKYFTRVDNTTYTSPTLTGITGTQRLLAHGASGSTQYFSRDGILETFTSGGVPTANSEMGDGTFLLKGYRTNEFYIDTGTIQEFIVYPIDKSTELSGIENNIKTYYGIS